MARTERRRLQCAEHAEDSAGVGVGELDAQHGERYALDSLARAEARARRAAIRAHQPARPKLDSAVVSRHEHGDVEQIEAGDRREDRRASGAAGLAVAAASLRAIG